MSNQLPVYQNYVHGRFLSNTSGETFPVVNPATGKVIYEVEIADESIQRAAIESARSGFADWFAMPAVERSRILLKAVALLRERNDDLARTEVLDTGKPWQEAEAVDVVTGADTLEFFAGLVPSMEGNQQDLATGNAMIFKPSEETPMGAMRLAEILTEAGVPAGVFNVVHGAAEVGQWLTHHPDIAKVSFTGEVGTGKKVMTAAATTLKDVTMELGGKSPLIIFDDADLENAISAAMVGNFYTQGEICTNGTRVFVHEDLYPRFMERLLERTRNNIVPGDPMDPATNYGALISRKHQERVLGYIAKGREEGATLALGGEAFEPEQSRGGYFVQPTIFTDCTDDMTIVKEEIFGPVMSVLTFSDEEEVIRRANSTDTGLAAGVFTNNIRRAHRVIHRIQAGICWINSYGASPAEMPVGGYKLSGIGRENGRETLAHYTQLKAVYVGMEDIDAPF